MKKKRRTYRSADVGSLITYHIDREAAHKRPLWTRMDEEATLLLLLLLFADSSNYAQRWINIENLLRSWKRALFSFVSHKKLFVCAVQCARSPLMLHTPYLFCFWLHFPPFVFQHNAVRCLHFGHAYSGSKLPRTLLALLVYCNVFTIMFRCLPGYVCRCVQVWVCVCVCECRCARRSMLMIFFSHLFAFETDTWNFMPKTNLLIFFSIVFHAHNGRFI